MIDGLERVGGLLGQLGSWAAPRAGRLGDPGQLRGELGEFAAIGILVVSALALLLAGAFAQRREPGFLRGAALLAVGLALAVTAARLGDPALDLGRFALGKALVVDHLTVACDLLALVMLAGVVGLARDHGSGRETGRRVFGEREPLLLLAGAGALTCIHAGDLIVVWLGVELLAIAALLATLASDDAVSNPSKRAGVLIQLIPGAIVSCLTLLGVALIYAALGTTNLDGFGRAATSAFTLWGAIQRWIPLVTEYAAEVAAQDPRVLDQAQAEIVRGMAPAALLLPGLLLLLFGLLARLGLLPFARRRELIEEAPLHVTALWSTLAVVALCSVLLRVYVGGLHSPRLVNEPYGWTGALPTVAVVSGGWAAIAATRQRRLPRVIALLSVTQLSLVLLGIVAAASFHGHIGVGARYIAPESEVVWARLAGDEAYAAVLIQLIAHTLAALGCFAAIAASRGYFGPEVRLQHWAGMAARRPGLALAFTLCLLSLVGLPPLAGFVGKLGILRAVVEHSAMRWLLVVVVVELAISAWVALRVIAAMYFGDETVSEPGEREPPSPWPARVATFAAALCVVLGLAGQRLIEFARIPATGGSFEPGSKDRLDWLEQRRASWAIEDARFEAGPEPLGADAQTEQTEGEAETEGDPAGEAPRSVDPTPASAL
jgi:NADH-quinone oxidoreductase subunit N